MHPSSKSGFWSLPSPQQRFKEVSAVPYLKTKVASSLKMIDAINKVKVLSTLTHSTPLVQSRNLFNKAEIHLTTLTNPTIQAKFKTSIDGVTKQLQWLAWPIKRVEKFFFYQRLRSHLGPGSCATTRSSRRWVNSYQNIGMFANRAARGAEQWTW